MRIIKGFSPVVRAIGVVGAVGVVVGGVAAHVAQVVEQTDSHKVLVYVPESTPLGNDLPLTVSIDSRTLSPAV